MPIGNRHGVSSGRSPASHHGTGLRGRRRGTWPRLGIPSCVSGPHRAFASPRNLPYAFQRADFSQANLISAVLFGDGAAGVVVTGRDVPGPRILTSECFLFPDSLGAMGFDLRDSGFHIVLSKDVPEMIRQRIKGLVDGFLERQGLTREDISAFILHPGGQKLLSFMQAELGLSESKIRRFPGTCCAALATFPVPAYCLFFRTGSCGARCHPAAMAC